MKNVSTPKNSTKLHCRFEVVFKFIVNGCRFRWRWSMVVGLDGVGPWL